MFIGEINADLKRAKEAFESAERNLKAGDYFTAANRVFVACENAVYVMLKLKFGSSTISRFKIITKLKDIDKEAKEAYDESYDLRVQADYGRKANIFPLTNENVEDALKKVRSILQKVESLARKKNDGQEAKLLREE